MIDFQGLLNVLHAGEQEENLRMFMWESSCGTSHCLIGSFCARHRDDNLQLRIQGIFEMPAPTLITDETLDYDEAVAARFGITLQEAKWLFMYIDDRFARKWTDAVFLRKAQALARLRKFIYYKLHKQEMIVETGRNRMVILPRHISGRRSASLASLA